MGAIAVGTVMAVAASAACGQGLAVVGAGGFGSAGGEATDPLVPEQVFVTTGPVPATVANWGVDTAASANPLQGTSFTSQASGWARMYFQSPPIGLQSIRWVVGSRARWTVELPLFYDNHGSATLNALLEMTTNPPPAEDLVVYYWWRATSGNRPKPELTQDDAAVISGTWLRLNGVPLAPFGTFNIDDDGWIVEPGQSGSITIPAGGSLTFRAQADVGSGISPPGVPEFNSPLGPVWIDSASNDFDGIIFFSLNAPIPPGGPLGTGLGLAACPALGSCYVAREDGGCADWTCCVTVCSIDVYCCNMEWDSGCVAQAFTLCPPCPVECAPGDTLEQEPCGLDDNGGCDTNGARQSIGCDVIVCGTMIDAGGFLDVDWYELDVADNDGTGWSTIELAVQTDFPMTVELLGWPCSALISHALFEAEQGPCGSWTSQIVTVPAPANYSIRLAPGNATTAVPSPLLCDIDGRYRLRVMVSDCHGPPPCVGNLNGDGAVDGADLGILLSNWGVCGTACVGDLDGNGVVDGADLGILLSNWGPCP